MRNEISLYRNWLKCDRMKLRRDKEIRQALIYRIRCAKPYKRTQCLQFRWSLQTHALQWTLFIPAPHCPQDTHFKFELSPNCVTGNRQLLRVILLITVGDTTVACEIVYAVDGPAARYNTASSATATASAGHHNAAVYPPEYFSGISQKQMPRGRGARNSTVQPWVRQINQVIRDNLLEKLKLKIQEAPSNSEPLIFLV